MTARAAGEYAHCNRRPFMTESSMLWRVRRETAAYHTDADNDRLAVLSDAADISGYAAYLARIYGFEAPLENALARTRYLDKLVDLRARDQLELIGYDLRALGANVRGVPRCATGFPFCHPAEALGWMYVVERNTLLHYVIAQRLRARGWPRLAVASSYLSTRPHATGTRLRALGSAMEQLVTLEDVSDRIIAAAKVAFEMQHSWYVAARTDRTLAAPCFTPPKLADVVVHIPA